MAGWECVCVGESEFYSSVSVLFYRKLSSVQRNASVSGIVWASGKDLILLPLKHSCVLRLFGFCSIGRNFWVILLSCISSRISCTRGPAISHLLNVLCVLVVCFPFSGVFGMYVLLLC